MKKGFTLIEILASIVILSILMAIGIISYRYIINDAEKRYYETLEQELLMVGNDYYNDNLIDRPLTGYNSVDIDKLIENNYIEKLKDHSGKDTCTGQVFIYKEDDKYEYEACLICENYQSSGNYCQGKIPGVIFISAKDKENNNYNPLLSYENVEYSASEQIDVTFNITENITKYIVTDIESGQKKDCLATNNSCTMSFNNNEGGRYQVEGYDNETKVGVETLFNIKFDKENPRFDLENTNKEFIIEEGTVYNYPNRVINLYDDTGIKSVKYTISNQNNIDITNNLIINEQLIPGVYKLSVTVVDNANRSVTKEIPNIKIGYKVQLKYDNREDEITVFLEEKYGDNGYLPDSDSAKNKEIGWRDSEGNVITNDTIVEKTTPHTLYARDRYTVTFNSNNNTFSGESNETTRTCIANNDGSCTITCPTIIAHANTPTIIGYTQSSTTYEVDSGYNTTNNTLTVNSNKTYYAQTKQDGNTLTVSYTKDQGVSEIGKTSDNCSYPTVYNGEEQEKSCNVTLPSISVSSGYATLGWYNGTTKVGDTNASYTISSNVSLTAKAQVTDTSGPTCSISIASTTLKRQANSGENNTTITFNCTDTSGVISKTLSASDFTISSGAMSITSVGSPTAISNGYSYVIGVRGEASGSATLTLKSGTLSDNNGNTSLAATSGAITVQTCTYRFRVSLTCASTSTSSSYTSGYNYTSTSSARSACQGWSLCTDGSDTNRSCTVNQSCS